MVLSSGFNLSGSASSRMDTSLEDLLCILDCSSLPQDDENRIKIARGANKKNFISII